MVTITNITKEEDKQFLSSKEFERIKILYERLPNGKFVFEKNNLICQLINENGNLISERLIAEVHYPGLNEFFTNIKDVLDKLIYHVEEAEIKNNILINENDRLKAKIRDYSLDET